MFTFGILCEKFAVLHGNSQFPNAFILTDKIVKLRKTNIKKKSRKKISIAKLEIFLRIFEILIRFKSKNINAKIYNFQYKCTRNINIINPW